MRKDINRAETRIALNILREINENSKEIRKDVVMDYVLNVLGLGMVVEEKELSEFIETDIKKVETKKAIKTFEKDEIEKVEMTIQEAVMQTEDLLNNLENEQVTEIDVNDIRALRVLTNVSKIEEVSSATYMSEGVFRLAGSKGLTLKESEDKLRELIEKLNGYNPTTITSLEIEAMEKLMKAKVLHEPIKLRVRSTLTLKSELEKLEEYGLIEKGDYTNLDITIG